MSGPAAAPATYGDLILKASLSIQAGVSSMQNLGFEDRGHAQAVIGDFQQLLRALLEHTWALLDLRRVDGIASTPTPDPRERSAVRLTDVVHDYLEPRAPSIPNPSTLSSSQWLVAARSVRAAGDLMATHADVDGLARTPDLDAVLRHPATRQAGLAQVGDMIATLVSGEDYLALRAAQAGLPWGEVRTHLPGMSEIRAHARDVAGTGSLPAWALLDDLTVARPPVRTGDPAGQIRDRMLRLRLRAWQDAASPHPSTGTLETFAVVGIAVHAHALAFHGVLPGKTISADRLTRTLVEVTARGRAWQEVYRGLRGLKSAEPADPAVTEGLAAVDGVLRAVAPLRGRQPDLAVGERRDVGQAIVGATAMMADIARWNRTAFTRMARAEQVYVRADALPGAAVRNSDVLAGAKLTGRCVIAAPEAVDTVASLYGRAAPPRNSALIGASGLTLRAEPLRAEPLRAEPLWAPATSAHPARDPIERT
ncbi:hypothetical protein [Pengzhenrongella sicca]|uniref:Uncharacterized protein n=1 Tax=Pengzhenrongella sicca TaxID=2819238 RepID=A0A8A4ZHR5_9MICO|nr:hypothetical protein [Pengzhenrongella sicca]QTE30066.1 hypothetical protein J4E96_03315 [Pengzhenrongella sicca]